MKEKKDRQKKERKKVKPRERKKEGKKFSNVNWHFK